MGERRVKVGRLTAFQDADDPSVESPLTSPTAESAAPRSTAIVVDDESFVISRDDERYDKWTRLLRQWPDKGLPIYVEAEGEGEAESGAQTRTARKIVSPQFKRILAVSDEPEDGWHRVVAEASPTFYFLSAQHPQHEKLLSLLRQSVETGQLLFVFIDPEGADPKRRTILDVEPGDDDDDRAPPADGGGERVEVVTAERIEVVAELGRAQVTGRRIEVVSHAAAAPMLAPSPLRSVITPAEANQIFNHLKFHPGIPFCFIQDCCVARSHKMSLVMLDLGVATHKVWNYGTGTLGSINPQQWTATLNFVSPTQGTFNWTFHTAPVVKVNFGGQIRERVIDPAVLTGPDTVNAWRSAQNDSGARYRFTPARIYWHHPHEPEGIERPPMHMERSLHSHFGEDSCP